MDLLRREAIGGFIGIFAVAALVREARAAAPEAGVRVRRWIEGQQDIAEALAAGRVTGLAWALEVERLAREVDVAELMAAVRAADVTPARPGGGNDPKKRFVRFKGEDGAPRRFAYGAALFDFAPANVVTPHGHRHMVSAHLVVEGRFRIRNFHRLGDEGEAMRIRPTRDYVAGAGTVSTMCSERDNIHWFVPVGGPAATFDVIVSGIDPGAPDHLIQAVDPLGAKALADGTLLAPVIGFEDSGRRYTADV
jgi:hypothetical protein